MSRPRILVFAYSDLGHACLKELLDRNENVVAVYTHDDSPTEKIWFPSVAALARERKVPAFTNDDLKNPTEQARVRELAPDLIFSFYYRHMIPTAILDLTRLGSYNMHGSHLPKYRGRAPVNWAVLHGETQTGATLHVMVAKADAGPIIDQEAVPIGPDDTTAIVQTRVTEAAVKVLARQIDNLTAGKAPRRTQDEFQATYYGRRKPEDGHIHWSRPAQEIHNLVRAVSHPYPGAFTDIFGVKTYIWQSRLSDAVPSNKNPGEIIIEKDCVSVVCGDGKTLEIIKLQNDGGEEISGAELARFVTEKLEKRGVHESFDIRR